jgi:hypothetical protein
MLIWSNLKRGAIGVTLCLLIGGLAVHSQTGGRDRSDPPSSRKQVTPSAQSVPSPNPTLTIIAPSEVRADGGRGQLLVYDLDPNDERIALGQKEPRFPGKVEMNWKEVEREYHWAVVTGVVDHHAIYESAKRSASGDPDSPGFYRRVDLELQIRNPDGSWSSWISVDPTPTIRVLDNLPEEDEELIEQPVPELVDPLPYLKNGKWQGVHVERLVPKGKVQIQVQVLPNAPGMRGGAPARPRQLPAELMLRSFDFSVSPGRTYRYRARVVVNARPRYGRLREVLGEWSRPTDAVTVP